VWMRACVVRAELGLGYSAKNSTKTEAKKA
jgi:hypothetical protein